jgi:sec-independent protein translocase protein TatB
MNLFGVGPLELALILIVALIFVGPDRLPRLAADIARTIREIRKYTGALSAEFQEVIKDVERETENERTVWKDVSEGIGGATRQVSEAVRGVRQDIMADTGAGLSNGSPPSNGAAPATGEPSSGAWVEIPDPDEPSSVPEQEPAEQAS